MSESRMPDPVVATSERRRLDHRLRRMAGRDPSESHRSATPLELFFDLTFVVAFSQAGSEAAHLLELGHFGPALLAFSYAVLVICWAWINYSWLASAYDNDDIYFRLATMVQMLGVLVLALGLPPLFQSIDEGAYIDNSLVVAGYVIMRISTVALWLRAARHNPVHRRSALTYATLVSIAQVGWVTTIFVDLDISAWLAITLVLFLFESTIPVIAERKDGGTPWHGHHIAERYGLLTIITLGEVVLGTILAISAVVEEQGWTLEAALVAFGGTTLAFALWWVYFILPSGEVLAKFRSRSFVWGYGHILVFGSLAATGAGLHVAAFEIRGVAHIGEVPALLTVVIPVGVFSLALFTLYTLLLRALDAFLVWLLIGSMVVLVLAVIAVAAGASMGVGILVTACSPIVAVVCFETIGHRRQAAQLERILAH
ncbi:low temperature requirement protein A [Streptomyces sp. ISL-90]|nr:low temperature requirement protein A [Streptomyces sp. ISL-90]